MHFKKYNEIHFIKHNSRYVPTPTCFGTGVTSSGTLRTQRLTSPTLHLTALFGQCSEYKKMLGISNIKFATISGLISC